MRNVWVYIEILNSIDFCLQTWKVWDIIEISSETLWSSVFCKDKLNLIRCEKQMKAQSSAA